MVVKKIRSLSGLRLLARQSLSAGLACLCFAVPATAENMMQLPEPSPFDHVSSNQIQDITHGSERHLIINPAELTFTTNVSGKGVMISGNCSNGSRVVASGRRMRNAMLIACQSGQFKAILENLAENSNADLLVSQFEVDGQIAVSQSTAKITYEHEILDLQKFLTSPQSANEYVKITPGNHSDMKFTLEAADTYQSPQLVIDGGGETFFDGKTELTIKRANVTLRGLVFNGDTTINIEAPNVRITNSTFTGCGLHDKPQSQCIMVSPQGIGAEIDFNRFTGSNSMTIKVRADIDNAPDQPFDAYIHHNEFRDIVRRSKNGQEPIQIAGPNGGASNVDLRTRVEHNLFVATNGDLEAISIKAPGVHVRWNGFFDMDAAPNLRGADGDEISGNLLVHTRPIRIAGATHVVSGNIILCPKDAGIAISHGSPGYAVAQHNKVHGNLVVTRKSAIRFFTLQPPPQELAHDNEIADNILVTPSNYPAIEVLIPGADNLTSNSIYANEQQQAGGLCS